MTLSLELARRVLGGRTPRVETDADAQPAAVALILYEGAAGLEALFIQRAERAGDPWSGQVALPGGRRDREDADLVATAIRETREETGIDLRSAERLGALDDLHPRTATLPPVVVRPVVFAVVRRPEVTVSPEVTEAFWVPLAALREPGVRRDASIVVRGSERTFPAYHHAGRLIWGMTERILTSFLDLLDG